MTSKELVNQYKAEKGIHLNAYDTESLVLFTDWLLKDRATNKELAEQIAAILSHTKYRLPVSDNDKAVYVVDIPKATAAIIEAMGAAANTTKAENEAEEQLVENILSEFEKIGIDTSEWEGKFGDGNFAHEFIAAGVQDHLEKVGEAMSLTAPKWIKASERLPKSTKGELSIPGRRTHDPYGYNHFSVIPDDNEIFVGNRWYARQLCPEDFEWLDESPTNKEDVANDN